MKKHPVPIEDLTGMTLAIEDNEDEDVKGFFHWYPPKKLEYGKPRLGESTMT